MKILHIAQSEGYGVTIYLENLIKGLNKANIAQFLLGSEYYAKDRYLNIVDKLITTRMSRNLTFSDLKTIVESRKVIKELKPDVIYCHSAKAGIYGRIACIGIKCKVIYNPHGWAFNMQCNKSKKFLYSIVEILLGFITSKIIAISDYERNTTPVFIPRSKVKVIKNGIDTEMCQKKIHKSKLCKSDLKLPNDSFIIGLVARISIQKGQDLFVEAAKKIKEQIPNAFFIVVGDKSDDIPIEELIIQHGLKESFLITGEVDNPMDYINLFDIAVLTSRWEGFGLVLPEYMVAKKPIVAFNIDAVSEIVEDNKNGFLVEKENTIAFAKAVIKLHHNKDLQRTFGTSGFERANRLFDIKRLVTEHNELFNSIIKQIKR